MSAWTCRSSDGQAARKIVPPHLRIPCWKGPSADSEEKREPVSDIDTVAVDSLKELDPKHPIREADMFRPTALMCRPTRFGARSHVARNVRARRAARIKSVVAIPRLSAINT